MYISTLLLLTTFLASTNIIAADSASVSATVTAQSISVSVSDGTITYGTIPNNSSKSTIATDLNDPQTATNDGNVSEDLNIKGQDSTDWTLSSTAGADQYVHRFCVSSCDTPPTSYTALTTNYQTLASNISNAASQIFHLQITTPTSSSVYTSQSVNVTVQAVAH